MSGALTINLSGAKRMEIRAIRGWARCDINSPVSSTSIQRRSWRSPVALRSALCKEIPAQDLIG